MADRDDGDSASGAPSAPSLQRPPPAIDVKQLKAQKAAFFAKQSSSSAPPALGPSSEPAAGAAAAAVEAESAARDDAALMYELERMAAKDWSGDADGSGNESNDDSDDERADLEMEQVRHAERLEADPDLFNDLRQLVEKLQQPAARAQYDMLAQYESLSDVLGRVWMLTPHARLWETARAMGWINQPSYTDMLGVIAAAAGDGPVAPDRTAHNMRFRMRDQLKHAAGAAIRVVARRAVKCSTSRRTRRPGWPTGLLSRTSST